MLNKDIPLFAQHIAETYGGSSGSMLLNIAESKGIGIKKDSEVHCLAPGECGITYHRYDTGSLVVVYDDTQTDKKKNFTVAHELGHILLGHHEELKNLMEYIEHLKEKQGCRAERQADIFAKSLLKARK